MLFCVFVCYFVALYNIKHTTMKKILFFIVSLLPISLFAQMHVSASRFDGMGTFLLIVLVCILIFLAIRELVCWYYKINKMVANQIEIIRLLKKIADESDLSPDNLKLSEDKKGVGKDLSDEEKIKISGRRI